MRKLALASAICLALSSGGAKALGLGEIEIKSSLNQPLDAQIELLSVRGGETDGMIVTLASQEAFLRAGIQRPFELTQLRFSVQQGIDGKPFIQVTSQKPVIEPFLNFLIEVDWPRGRLLREYTVLLDPPVFMTQPHSSQSTVAPQLQAEVASRPAAAVPAPISRPALAASQSRFEAEEPLDSTPVGRFESEPLAEESLPEPSRPAVPPSRSVATQPKPAAARLTESDISTWPDQPRREVASGPRQGTLYDRRKSLVDRLARQRLERSSVVAERRAPAAISRAPQPTRFSSVPAPVEREGSRSGSQGMGGDYAVRRNDTLWTIAARARGNSGVSVQQMMLAILRHNPQAFIDDNINLLKRGVVLRIPDARDASSLTMQEAVAQVKEHNALWRELADRSSAQPPVAVKRVPQPPAPAPVAETRLSQPETTEAAEPERSVVEPVTAQPERSAAPGSLSLLAPDQESRAEDADDRTQITDQEQQDQSGVAKSLSMAKEGLNSEKLRNRELRSQVAELERTVSKMDQLVSIQESELADLQNRLKQLREEREASAVAESMAAEQTTAAPIVRNEPQGESQPTAVADTQDAGVADSEESSAPRAARSVGEESTPSSELSTAETAPLDGADETNRLPQTLLPTPPEGGGLGDWLKEPQMLAAGGGITLLLAGLAGWMFTRRKRSEDEDEEAAVGLTNDLSVSDADDRGADGEMTVDDDEVSAVADEQPGFAGQSETQVLDQEQMEDVTREAREARARHEREEAEFGSDNDFDDDDDLPKDDTIAEADVYLAYGLYPQAEDLLKGALRDKPGRLEYQEKLLETYFASKNIQAFEETAEQFKRSIGDSHSSLWDRVVVMGKELSPRHALFAGAVVSEAMRAEDFEPIRPSVTDMDVDETDIADVNGLDFGLEESLGGEELNFKIPSSDNDELELLDDVDDTQVDSSLSDDDSSLDFNTSLDGEERDALSMEEDALLDASLDQDMDFEFDDLGLTDVDNLDSDSISGSAVTDSSADSAIDDHEENGLGLEDDFDMSATGIIDLNQQSDLAQAIRTGQFPAYENDEADKSGDSDFGFDDEADLDDEMVDDLDEAMLEEEDGLALDLNDDLEDADASDDDPADDQVSEEERRAAELAEEEDDLLASLDMEGMEGLEGLDLAALEPDEDELEQLSPIDESTLGGLDEVDLPDDSSDDLPALELGSLDDEETLIEAPDHGLGDDAADDSLMLESMDESLHLDSIAETLHLDGMDRTMVDEPDGFGADLDDLGDIDSFDESDDVETQLDLAQAYIQMGDSDGARGALEEIITSDKASEQQKSTAKGLMGKLSGS